MSSQAIRKSLLAALRHQDFEGFRSIIRSVGLPRDSCIDYELLAKAIKTGCKRIANLLLDHGARVVKKRGLATPLHHAVTKGTSWIQLIERLLEKGARVSDKDSHGDTPLHVAFGCRAPGQMIDLLLNKHLEDSNENLANRQKLSFLHIAASRPNVQVVAKLIIGTSYDNLICHQVSCKTDTSFAGYTPVHFAAENGNLNVLEYLLKCDPLCVYSADSTQSSPLHLALERRDVEMVDLIFAHDKFRCVCTNKNGLSHLMASCISSDPCVIKDILRNAKRGIDDVRVPSLVNSSVVNSNKLAGYTPLHFAAEFGRTEAIEALLDEGADCCTETHRGLTAHDLATENVRELLDNHCNFFKGCPGDFNNNYKVICEE